MSPRLIVAMISFHTNNEDKDDDTTVYVELEDFNRNTVAKIVSNFEYFRDDSDSLSYGLEISNNCEKTDLERGYINIRISPHGNDTWRFNFFLTLVFSDGSILSGRSSNLDLSEDNTTTIIPLQDIF